MIDSLRGARGTLMAARFCMVEAPAAPAVVRSVRCPWCSLAR